MLFLVNAFFANALAAYMLTRPFYACCSLIDQNKVVNLNVAGNLNVEDMTMAAIRQTYRSLTVT